MLIWSLYYVKQIRVGLVFKGGVCQINKNQSEAVMGRLVNGLSVGRFVWLAGLVGWSAGGLVGWSGRLVL